MINRREEARKRNLAIVNTRGNTEDIYAPARTRQPLDFSKIKVGPKTLEDAVLELTKNISKRSTVSLKDVETAIVRNDIDKMREYSILFSRTKGIYSRLCRYLAYLYRYDWFITPYIAQDKSQDKKVLELFYNALNYLDEFGVKKFFGEVTLEVIIQGCYYCYLVDTDSGVAVQALPTKYCRSRYNIKGRPAVEMNMKYFDDTFSTEYERDKVLSLFPPEFAKGYKLYRAGKLKAESTGDEAGWYLLDTDKAYKFDINGCDVPVLMPVIPAIINLEEAQELDKKRMAQKLIRIILQKLPLNKDGDIMFDVEEARDIHQSAVNMVGTQEGIKVLTSFADIEVANMEESNATAADDSMERARQAVYDEAGISQLQFNSEGNIALNNSILNDEAMLKDLILQYEKFLNGLLERFNKAGKKAIRFRAQILNTTIYNYKEMAKLYKEQTQLGYSKMLPQIALGQSQSSILANAYFENEILQLATVFIPPLMSSTMNAEAIAAAGNKSLKPGSNSEGAGRTELPDNEKSEKTIQNKESMN